ncbi:hypothetical protein [Clostridium botulinum]|uniref:hypothetical protein n=1 Tax=Clostridium botulinum TaxID=1491 RepID=UPI0002A308B7|nr:hypothetical protein [Clostridium botulinum]EKX79939.1 hypothetical protein CFSAN001628_009643 [Clostridium botulinum CFSAN001628]MBD5563694.1 hypothetical protein [Clostridium botulinum]MBD5568422.1 hypothetical protein [Clostridium botulinum]MBD5572114.1 hypothetical protein [Clostridium botulinum]MBD5579263.1 hypothetical protein [Clostridium botulinum]
MEKEFDFFDCLVKIGEQGSKPIEAKAKSRIYTEIRIAHKDKEEKEEYEKKLDEALKEQGYKNRAEWLNEKYRDLIKEHR